MTGPLAPYTIHPSSRAFGVGGLPCLGEKLCPRDWALLLILKIVEPCHELGTAIWLSIHHPEASSRHRDDDVSIPCLDVEIACAHRCCHVSSHPAIRAGKDPLRA
jgi:hypothetical protein